MDDRNLTKYMRLMNDNIWGVYLGKDNAAWGSFEVVSTFSGRNKFYVRELEGGVFTYQSNKGHEYWLASSFFLPEKMEWANMHFWEKKQLKSMEIC